MKGKKTPLDAMQTLINKKKFNKNLFSIILFEIHRKLLYKTIGYQSLNDYILHQIPFSLDQVFTTPQLTKTGQILNPALIEVR